VLVLPLLPNAAAGQAGEVWWPHPLWGPDDQAGGSNWITPEKVVEAISLVQTGRIYELGHPYGPDMPIGAGRTFDLTVPSFPTGTLPEAGLVYNDERLTATIGQVGTQFDGPGHIGKRLVSAYGDTTDVYYNGMLADSMRGDHGLRNLGVEHVKPYVTRGLLIDLAGYKGVETLPGGYVVTLDDVRGALAAQGMSEDAVHPGDAVLFNYGWWRLWPSPDVLSGWPGIGPDVAAWVIEEQAAMVGSDAPTDEPGHWAVHQDLVLKNGIFNLEYMTFEGLLADQVYEFLFIFTPLPLEGATGSPGRPLAIR
jgi:hypothetical protein